MVQPPSHKLVGVLIEFFYADFLVIIGLTGQKLALMGHKDNFTKNRYLMINWRWLISLIVFIVGSAGEMFALKFASAVVVSSISNLTLVWQVVASIYIFKEDFAFRPLNKCGRRILAGWDFAAYLILILGSFVAVVFSPPEKPGDADLTAKQLIERWGKLPFAPFAALLFAFLVFNAVMTYRYIKYKKEGNRGAVYIGCVGGALAAFSVTLSKIVVDLISKTASGDNQFNNPYAFIMFAAFLIDITGVVYTLNLGLKRFEAALFVPMYEILGTLLTMLSGMIYYETYTEFTPGTAVGFCAGVILMCWGIYLASLREHKTETEIQVRFRRSAGSRARRFSAVDDSVTQRLIRNYTSSMSARSASRSRGISGLGYQTFTSAGSRGGLDEPLVAPIGEDATLPSIDSISDVLPPALKIARTKNNNTQAGIL